MFFLHSLRYHEYELNPSSEKVRLCSWYTRFCFYRLARYLSSTSPSINFFTSSASYNNVDATGNDITTLTLAKLTLAKYNPLAGQQITEVRFTLNAGVIGRLSITNTFTSGRNYRLTHTLDEYNVTAGVSFPAALSSLNLQPFTLLLTIFSVPTNMSLAADGTATFRPTAFFNSSASTQSYTLSSEVLQFLGTGTFSLEIYPITGLGLNQTGGSIQSSDT